VSGVVVDDDEDGVRWLQVATSDNGAGRRLAVIATVMSMALAIIATSAVLVVSIGRLREREQLVDQIGNLQIELTRQHTNDDNRLDRNDCEAAYGRRITAALDDVNGAEAAVFVKFLRNEPLDPAIRGYSEAVQAFTSAVAVRDAYIANGSPLPCPLEDG